jgi:16S rRNA (guanine527-N7)-methyltransferase
MFDVARLEPQQKADLEAFEARLNAINPHMNLVAASTLPEFWTRHVADSAQLLDLAPEALTWADLGAGGGFPGLVLAILLKGRPEAKVILVESQAKKCRFLSDVVAALDLPAQVINARAETLALKVDVVTARALAPLAKLLGYAEPLLKRGAKGVFLKGERIEEEIVEARGLWRFDYSLAPSQTDPRGRIIIVEKLKRAG